MTKHTNTKKTDLKDKPYIDNYPPLHDWLRANDAICQWQLPLGPRDNPQGYVEMYQIGRASCIVTVWANQNGWEVYTPGNSNNIDATLVDAGTRLGLVSR